MKYSILQGTLFISAELCVILVPLHVHNLLNTVA